MNNWGFALRVILKAAVLFIIFNVIFALVNPNAGKISLYNVLLKGRDRLPYGEDSERSYNLSLNNLEAMFASHEISQSKSDEEFRVLVLGDSGVWGILLEPNETLTGQLNAQHLLTEERQKVVFYNLGHPIQSLTKDLLILDYAMQYQPDMIIWLVTLNSFARSEQLYPPIVNQNPEKMRDLIRRYDLNLDLEERDQDFIDQTIWGQRRPLADLLRLQLYGVMWTVMGIDQYYPEEYPLRSRDFAEDTTWKINDVPQSLDDLSMEVLLAGIERAGNVPILIVNEPIFISDGINSDLRYNAWYPREIYDEYRQLLATTLADQWYIDVWDAIPPDEFTDSPVHLTPEGSRLLSEIVGREVMTK